MPRPSAGRPAGQRPPPGDLCLTRSRARPFDLGISLRLVMPIVLSVSLTHPQDHGTVLTWESHLGASQRPAQRAPSCRTMNSPGLFGAGNARWTITVIPRTASTRAFRTSPGFTTTTWAATITTKLTGKPRGACSAPRQTFPWRRLRTGLSCTRNRAARCRKARIGQYIDIGPGLPTQGNVHQIVHQYDPRAQVLYVDNDPAVVSHARSLLKDVPGVSITEGSSMALS